MMADQQGAEVPPMFEDDLFDLDDATVGRVVRSYKGLARPPLVIVQKPRWWEVMLVITTLALAGAVVFGAQVLATNIALNREKGDKVLYVLCDPGRLAGDPSARTLEICDGYGR